MALRPCASPICHRALMLWICARLSLHLGVRDEYDCPRYLLDILWSSWVEVSTSIIEGVSFTDDIRDTVASLRCGQGSSPSSQVRWIPLYSFSSPTDSCTQKTTPLSPLSSSLSLPSPEVLGTSAQVSFIPRAQYLVTHSSLSGPVSTLLLDSNILRGAKGAYGVKNYVRPTLLPSKSQSNGASYPGCSPPVHRNHDDCRFLRRYYVP
jgi:hypothetical protein